MKDKRLLVFLFCLCLCAQAAYADDEEDFDPQEEGKVFDHAKTGLLFKRAMYNDGENITFVPYFPITYNDTREFIPGKIYVTHWEQDPPSFLTVYINNDTPKLTSVHEIDVQISIAQHDWAKNNIYANRKIIRGITLGKGINRVPVNIHNYKGDIVEVRLLGQRMIFPILPIEVAD